MVVRRLTTINAPLSPTAVAETTTKRALNSNVKEPNIVRQAGYDFPQPRGNQETGNSSLFTNTKADPIPSGSRADAANVHHHDRDFYYKTTADRIKQQQEDLKKEFAIPKNTPLPLPLPHPPNPRNSSGAIPKVPLRNVQANYNTTGRENQPVNIPNPLVTSSGAIPKRPQAAQVEVGRGQQANVIETNKVANKDENVLATNQQTNGGVQQRRNNNQNHNQQNIRRNGNNQINQSNQQLNHKPQGRPDGPKRVFNAGKNNNVIRTQNGHVNRPNRNTGRPQLRNNRPNQAPTNNRRGGPRKPKSFDYTRLIELDKITGFIWNRLPFECPICMTECVRGEGVVIRACLHSFCKECLVNAVEHCEEIEMICPAYQCNEVVQHQEIRRLVPRPVFEKFLSISIRLVEQQSENAFHCKTPNCRGWWVVEGNVDEFRCLVCHRTSCMRCDAFHFPLTCHQYKARKTDQKSKDVMEALVRNGNAMKCPKCKIILQKIEGCDAVTCTVCKTEICWATRGPRWGPMGIGDTSGGCRCGINGIKCHPTCLNCH